MSDEMETLPPETATSEPGFKPQEIASTNEASPPKAASGVTSHSSPPSPDGVKIEGDLEASGRGSSLQVANQIYNDVHHHYAEQDEASFRILTRKHFQVVETQDLVGSDLIFDAEEVARVAEALRWVRFVLICGGRVGKGVLAKAAAAHLIHGSAMTPTAVLHFDALERDLRVSFERFLGPRVRPGRNLSAACASVFILEDALEFENLDVKRLLSDLDGHRLESLRTKLENTDSYILLTLDAVHIASSVRQLSNLGVLQEVRGPGVELRRIGLYRQAERLLLRKVSSPESEGDEVRRFLERHSAQVSEELETMPEIVRFAETYLLAVAAGDGVTLREALDKAKREDLTNWFVEGLANDLEALSLVIALTFSYAGPHTRAAPWFQVYGLWLRVLEILRKELRHAATKELETVQLGVGSKLLNTARAESLTAPFPDCHSVCFRDSTYPERLWEVLSGPGRALLCLLLPLLRELSESRDFYLRCAAARALGRVGALDGRYVLFPWLRDATASKKIGSWVAAGQALLGVLGTRNDDYRDASLQWLKKATQGREGNAAWARAICIRELGQVDLELALREWRTLLEEKLGSKVRHLRDLDGGLKRAEGELRREAAKTGQSRRIDEFHEDLMRRLAREVLTSNEIEALNGLQFGLVGLCMASDPILVFSQLLPWMNEADTGLPVLLVILFLDAGGLAAKLERNEVTLPADLAQGASISCGRILAALALAPADGVPILTTFVDKIYQCNRLLPSALSTPLRENFLCLLEHWARVAVRSKASEVMSIVEDLLAGLLASPDKLLREEMFHLLQHDRAFAGNGSELRSLAVRILTRPTPRRGSTQLQA